MNPAARVIQNQMILYLEWSFKIPGLYNFCTVQFLYRGVIRPLITPDRSTP